MLSFSHSCSVPGVMSNSSRKVAGHLSALVLVSISYYTLRYSTAGYFTVSNRLLFPRADEMVSSSPLTEKQRNFGKSHFPKWSLLKSNRYAEYAYQQPDYPRRKVRMVRLSCIVLFLKLELWDNNHSTYARQI